MKKILLVLVLAGSVTCISVAKIEDRQTQVIHETTIKKNEAYDRGLIWIAKRAGNSNYSIKIQDKNEGRIIARVSTACRPLNGLTSNITMATKVDFNIDYTAKDGKVRIIFDDILALQTNAQNPLGVPVGPEDKSELDVIDKICLAPLRTELIAAIEGKAANTKKDDF